VRDDGAGFDPKLNEQLFQPFHQLHCRSEFPGPGNGAAHIRALRRAHLGRGRSREGRNLLVHTRQKQVGGGVEVAGS